MADNTSTAARAEPFILALDIGTSSARALVYDGCGNAVPALEAHQPYSVRTTADGGVESLADDLVGVVAAAVDVIYRLIVKQGIQISAVACDTYWHSLVGVDTSGSATTPVFTWADTRSASDAQALRAQLDEQAAHARTGARIHSSYWPAKLRWLKRTNPDAFARTRHWISFGDYLYLQLFGDLGVTVSMASGTGVFDQRACTWDDALLHAVGVDVTALAPIHDTEHTFTGLRGDPLQRWPLLAKIPWYLPLGDGGCNNVGSGGTDDHRAVIMVGTSGALRVLRRTDTFTIPEGLWTYRLDRSRIVQGGAMSAGGNVFAWLTDRLHVAPSPQLEERLAAMKPDVHGLTMLPFFAGERSPHWAVDARAAILGMRLDTTDEEMIRAGLEAVAYQFGAVYGLLRQEDQGMGELIGSGVALVHSPVWMQIMSDVLGQTILASAVAEATSRGAALMALEAMGHIADVSDVEAPTGTKFRPGAECTQKYAQAMQRQQNLYDMVANFSHAERSY